MFSSDVARSVDFYADALGLRLSDRSGDVVAFMHGAHASDHHLLAFAKSTGPGLHHSSWVVSSIDEIGLGMQHMADSGYDRAWGVGHVWLFDPGSHRLYTCDTGLTEVTSFFVPELNLTIGPEQIFDN